MGTKNPFRLLLAFALLAKLAAGILLFFVFLSAISTADDQVQQDAVAQSRLHVFRACKPVPPTFVSGAQVIASSFRYDVITRCVYNVHEQQLLTPLAESLRRLPGRSPPRIYPV